MPIEIKELHIKAIVASGKNEAHTNSLNAVDVSKLKKEITEQVTKNVLKILMKKNDR